MATSPVIHRRLSLVEKIAADRLSALSYWSQLDPNQQEQLNNTVHGLSSELRSQWQSILRSGQLIHELQELTTPFGEFRHTFNVLWGKYISINTAYRWRNIYLAVRDKLSEQVVQVAVASGIKLVTGDERRPFGDYTELVEAIPAPKNDTAREAYRWLEEFRKRQGEVARAPRTIHSIESNPREISKQTFLRMRNAFRRLQGRSKALFVDDMIGYLLWMDGRASQQTFMAASPPEEWQNIQRGRPRAA